MDCDVKGNTIWNRRQSRIERLIRRWKLGRKIQRFFPDFNQRILEEFLANFGYAMPLSLLVKIEKICREIKPTLVIEFGSGLSTVVMSNALSGMGSFLISIDESIHWLANIYQSIIHTSHLAFICLPYDSGINYPALSEYLLVKVKPELVIIDGPSRSARFLEPALEVYYELLSPKCVCIIDDTDRKENESGASVLATKFSLHKVDYGDQIYVNHKYSILFPRYLDEVMNGM